MTKPQDQVTAAIAKAADENIAKLKAQLAAVSEVHEPHAMGAGYKYCGHCSDLRQDYVEYPCPTAQAIGVPRG